MYTPAENEAPPQVQENIKTQLSTERDQKKERERNQESAWVTVTERKSARI